MTGCHTAQGQENLLSRLRQLTPSRILSPRRSLVFLTELQQFTVWPLPHLKVGGFSVRATTSTSMGVASAVTARAARVKMALNCILRESRDGSYYLARSD